jgi:hypothetical protein
MSRLTRADWPFNSLGPSSTRFSLWGLDFLLHAPNPPQPEACAAQTALQLLRKLYGEGQIVELTRPVCMANFTNRFNYALEMIPDCGV